ncbi:uncharacterized protein LOC128983585 [Macrosteles quadrilineatus]|uniref:uncharacterized protein LOC128983585 n=1 Tax=Macrosteles quadrilineatus TaxID=74068 RepID=UPI0023E2A9B9|nr:uncharacterized protein LOC128983585 [Macrosteles quadrilineatus]
MNPLGNCSKLLRSLSRQNFQVLRRCFVDKHGDEDIKWQWSVRESPCQECHKYEKKGWLKFWGKKQTEELTNRHIERVRKPKIWEWEYYDYLLPQCKEKLAEEKLEYKTPSTIPCGGLGTKECQGKQILIHLEDEHRFKQQCHEKFKFELKDSFGLKEVCGKLNDLKGVEVSQSEEKEKEDFCCLNNLIDENKEKQEEESKNSQCDYENKDKQEKKSKNSQCD